MKQCPDCNRSYADALNYCVADGSRLFTTTEAQEADTLTISKEALTLPMNKEDAETLFSSSSVEQAASALNKKIAFRNERRNWHNSERGLQEIKPAVDMLFNDLQHLAEEISGQNPEVQIQFTKDNSRQCTLRCGRISLGITFTLGYINTLDGSGLSVALFERKKVGLAPTPRGTDYYDLDIDENLRVGWSERKGNGQFFMSIGLANKCIETLVNHLAKSI
ncbi:MAG: hypothetical protein QOH25_3337 [Acidobacteriota bacterium]|jgi:hypothetical protein|nr:hypothetical protein [Acidobacteriota bacterium]